MQFKNIPKDQRPREKAIKQGLKSLSDCEIISLFLRTGSRYNSVLVLAQKVLEKIKGISNLSRINYQEILEIKGIGKAKATELMASFELVRRIKLMEKSKEKIKIKQPRDVFNVMKYEFENISNEHFYLMLLNKNNELLNKKQLYQGTNNQVLIDLRDIFEFALINKAQKIICIHNHPSGYSNPSKDDLSTTKGIQNVAQKLNIVFVDHIIIGKDEFYSLILKKKFKL